MVLCQPSHSVSSTVDWFAQTEHHNSGSISVHHVLLADPLELHTSLALSHTLSYQHHLPSKELIYDPAV